MRIKPLTTIGALVLMASLFVPWVNNGSWWLQGKGALVNLAEKSFRDLSYCDGLDCFNQMEGYQYLSVLGCFVFLIAAAILSLYHRQWMGHGGAVFGVAGMVLFTFISLEALTAVPVQYLGIGFYMGWCGSIIVGWGIESET
ncbi:MAG: hypothetical protein PHZ19_01995 [Candidatus Thermoplasmatota archaeon]|nr:hypothetical protein [Candidatus Thermoplasmatota archaeon]